MFWYYYHPKHTGVSLSLWLCINMGYAYITVYYYNNILWAASCQVRSITQLSLVFSFHIFVLVPQLISISTLSNPIRST